MPRENISNLNSIESCILDSGNQFIQFKFFIRTTDDIIKIRECILNANLKTLEDYTSKTKIKLEKIKPGICEEYNTLIEELKDPNLTPEKLKEIVEKGYKLTRII